MFRQQTLRYKSCDVAVIPKTFCTVLTIVSPSFLASGQANRAHTYLGKREAEWHETQNEEDIYPDFVMMAKAFGVPARRVIKKAELRAGVSGTGYRAYLLKVCHNGQQPRCANLPCDQGSRLARICCL